MMNGRRQATRVFLEN
nr:unnamed protein product [Callosobruchus analis]